MRYKEIPSEEEEQTEFQFMGMNELSDEEVDEMNNDLRHEIRMDMLSAYEV